MKKVERNRIKAYWKKVLKTKGHIPQEKVDEYKQAIINWKKEEFYKKSCENTTNVVY